MTSSSAVALCAAAILAASMVGTALGQSECAMYRQKSQCEGVSVCTWCTDSSPEGGYCWAGNVCPTEPPRPVVGKSFSMTMNATMVMPSGKEHHVVERMAVDGTGAKMLISVVTASAPIPFDHDLTIGLPSCTSAQWMSPSKMCNETCKGGNPCKTSEPLLFTPPPPPPPPNASCGCGVADIFDGVQFAVYTGNCGPDHEAYEWTLASSGVTIRYCFNGNTPLSIDEEFTSPSDGMPHEASAGMRRLLQDAPPSPDDDWFGTPKTAHLGISQWDPAVPPSSDFVVPSFCQCKQ